MNPISTRTLGISAARSTMNPAWRDGLGNNPSCWLQRADHLAEPCVRSRPGFPGEPGLRECWRRWARGCWNCRPAEAVGTVLPPGQSRGLRVGGGVRQGIDAGAPHLPGPRARPHAWRRTAPPSGAVRCATRSSSGMKISRSRVSSTRQRPLAMSQLPAQFLGRVANAMCFSYVPDTPIAPGSLPPWPGSRNTIGSGPAIPPAA